MYRSLYKHPTSLQPICTCKSDVLRHPLLAAPEGDGVRPHVAVDQDAEGQGGAGRQRGNLGRQFLGGRRRWGAGGRQGAEEGLNLGERGVKA